MRRPLQLLAFALDALALLVFVLVPAHAYGWMRDLEPSMGQLPADPDRDIRLLLTGAAAALAAGLNLLLAARAAGRTTAVVNVAVAVLLGAVWGIRYLL